MFPLIWSRIGLMFLFLFPVCHTLIQADTKAFKIIDDPDLDAALADVREEFLESHPTVTRLDATILVLDKEGAWRGVLTIPIPLPIPPAR